MKKNLILVLLFVTITTCVICVMWVFNPVSILDSFDQGCTLPPEWFSEADLVGSWVAGVPRHSDTLIVREDGTYKQIIHIEYSDRPDVDYEGDWQPWWLEYSQSGTPYLHLEGMRLCAAESVSCDQVGGGNIKWYDICRDEWVFMHNEGVLMVGGVPKRFDQPPRGITMVLFTQWIENPWGYRLQEP